MMSYRESSSSAAAPSKSAASTKKSSTSGVGTAVLIAVGFAASAVVTILIYHRRRKQLEQDQERRDEKAREQMERLNNLGLNRMATMGRNYGLMLAASDMPGGGSGSYQVDIKRDMSLLRQLCPHPFVPKSVSVGGLMNCYKPCPTTFESWPIAPKSEDEFTVEVTYVNGESSNTAPTSDTKQQGGGGGGDDTNGGNKSGGGGGKEVIKPEAYFVCRATCPPIIDSTTGRVDKDAKDPMDGAACYRGAAPPRAMGSGPDIVKCGWTLPYQGKNFDRACNESSDWGYSPDCQHGRQDTSYLKDTNQSFCTQWYGPSSERVHLWVAPVACGGDYELLPAHPSAYFTKNMTGFNAGYKGFGPGGAGMRCFQRCKPGDIMIPSGLKEAHLCAQPCPKNTREIPTDPHACIKDGFKQEIVMEDLGREIGRVLQQTASL